MRVLVATSATQGRRASDFCWAVEGELAGFPFVCDRDDPGRPGFDPDGGCGCGRAFCGLSSGKGTTTARVTERDGMTPADLIAALRAAYDAQGWAALMGEAETAAMAEADAADLTAICAAAGVGDVVEKRGGTVAARPGSAS